MGVRHERNTSIAIFERVFSGLQTFILSQRSMEIGDTVLLKEVTSLHSVAKPEYTGRTYEFWIGYVQHIDKDLHLISITEVE